MSKLTFHALERGLKLLFGFGSSIAIARSFDLISFGALGYAKAIQGILITFSAFGLAGLISSEVLKNENNAYRIITTSFIIKLIASVTILIISVLYFSLFETNKMLASVTLIVLAQLPFFAVEAIEQYYYSKSDYRILFYHRIISITLASLFLWRSIALGDFILSILCLLLASSIYFISLSYSFFRKFRGVIKEIDFAIAKDLFRKGGLLIAAGLFARMNLKVDQIMIESILGLKYAGEYSAVTNLLDPLSILSAMILTVLFPKVLKMSQRGNESRNRAFKKITNLVTLFSLFIIIVLFFGSEFIISTIYGTKYLGSVAPLRLYSLCLLFLFWNDVVNKWVLVVDNFKFPLYANGFGALINIGLNLILMPKLGISGAAISSIVSYGLTNFIALYFFSNMRELFWIEVKSLIGCFNLKELVKGLG
jgi:O-antigen/teichoic acid export membrane protein